MLVWRQIQKTNFTSLSKLASFLELDQEKEQKLLHHSSFPLNLPRRLAEKIKKNCLEDPILLQFVSLKKEEEKNSSYSKDPVSDLSFCKTPKLLKKYQERVLLLTTSGCAMHCRYCFRQHFPYPTLEQGFELELREIQKESSLKEIILSGGDPLSLGNERFKNLLARLDEISHLERLRIHTRFPIGIPERIDEEFLNILEATRLQIWFVIHSNHPLELDEEVIHALRKIQKKGIPLLNQSVLLKGVNDNIETLYELSSKLTRHGILPYYLHQLDQVQGAAHFEVDEKRGGELIGELTSLTSGFGVPKYVKEEPKKYSKTLLA